MKLLFLLRIKSITMSLRHKSSYSHKSRSLQSLIPPLALAHVCITANLPDNIVTQYNVQQLSLNNDNKMWWKGVKFLEENLLEWRAHIIDPRGGSTSRVLMRTNLKGIYWQQITSLLPEYTYTRTLIDTNTVGRASMI